jgi:hypothetical protein
MNTPIKIMIWFLSWQVAKKGRDKNATEHSPTQTSVSGYLGKQALVQLSITRYLISRIVASPTPIKR